jgi:uncharacterized protein YndB with AHSA1/START domain
MNILPSSIERTFNAPIQNVWKAITQQELMKQWYFDFREFKAVVGFQFTGGPAPDNQYVDLCENTEVIPRKKTHLQLAIQRI